MIIQLIILHCLMDIVNENVTNKSILDSKLFFSLNYFLGLFITCNLTLHVLSDREQVGGGGRQDHFLNLGLSKKKIGRITPSLSGNMFVRKRISLSSEKV